MIFPDSPPVAPPNWDKWRSLFEVELWQAVALSLNLEPDKLPVYMGAYELLGDDPFRVCPSDFRERLEIANSHGGATLPLKPVHSLKARCIVELPTFGAWAGSIWSPLPNELPRAVPMVQVPTNKTVKNKGAKTLAFEAEVIRLMAHFWDNRPNGTTPTKGDLHSKVYFEMLRGKIRPQYATVNVGMVRDAAKPWRKPHVLPSYVPPAQLADKRHPFKGER